MTFNLFYTPVSAFLSIQYINISQGSYTFSDFVYLAITCAAVERASGFIVILVIEEHQTDLHLRFADVKGPLFGWFLGVLEANRLVPIIWRCTG